MAGGMDHSTQATPELVAESDTIAAGAAAPDAMDHGNMQMQGGSAPADARDPHAYSDGYSLGEGKYALSDQRQLRLADEHNFGSVLVDRLEWAHAKDGNSANYGVQAWFGRDYNRVVLKAEGSVTKGKLEDARTELLWGHAGKIVAPDPIEHGSLLASKDLLHIGSTLTRLLTLATTVGRPCDLQPNMTF